MTVTVTSVKTNERKKWLTIAARMLEVVKYTDTGLASNRSSFVLHWPKHKTPWKCKGGGVFICSTARCTSGQFFAKTATSTVKSDFWGTNPTYCRPSSFLLHPSF